MTTPIELAATECSQPCDPNTGCPECVAYWMRMEAEGYWDGSQWTEKGIGEMTK